MQAIYLVKNGKSKDAFEFRDITIPTINDDEIGFIINDLAYAAILEVECCISERLLHLLALHPIPLAATFSAAVLGIGLGHSGKVTASHHFGADFFSQFLLFRRTCIGVAREFGNRDGADFQHVLVAEFLVVLLVELVHFTRSGRWLAAGVTSAHDLHDDHLLTQLAEFFHRHARAGEFGHKSITVAFETFADDAVDVVFDILWLDDAADLGELGKDQLAVNQAVQRGVAELQHVLLVGSGIFAVFDSQHLLLSVHGVTHLGFGDDLAVHDGCDSIDRRLCLGRGKRKKGGQRKSEEDLGWLDGHNGYRERMS